MVKERRREELCVSVPTLFRCPISMDLMKSPVSLCTGVTYDRSSIETWLALGHNTCPATMQTLPSTHTTPNLTLRRLIHLWLLSQADAALKSPLEVTKQEAADIIKGEFNADSLAKLVNFMANSEENLKFVAESRDCVSKLVETLSKSGEIRICEMIVGVLNSILQGNGVKERLNELILKTGDDGDCLSSFILILQKGNVEAKVKSAEILELIAVNLESRLKIAEKQGLLYELYNLSTAEADASASAVEAGLSALLAISTSRPAKKELIRFGIVKTVGKILSGGSAHNSLAVRAVIEKGLAILELVATCTEGRGAICDDVECVVGIVKNLMKCSSAATEHGITVIWSVCCLARDRMAQEMVMKVNGLTKVLLVMQSDCSLNTRKMCGELVKILRVKNGKSNLAPYETRTTHITPY